MQLNRRETDFKYLVPLVLAVVSTCVCQLDEDVPGFGIWNTLRGFAGELENVFKEVSTGVQKLGNHIRSFEEFLDATVDEDCYFECPPGQLVKSRKDHAPKSNGCGSFGLEQFITPEMLPNTGFVDCCDEHDICYETCGRDKDECDLKFKKCLYRKCAAVKDGKSAVLQQRLSAVGCKAGAKLLYTGTTAVGCKPYLNAQQNACYCKPIKDEF